MPAKESVLRRLDSVTIRSLADIRPAAEAMRDIALSACRLRVAACDSIASKAAMVDAKGNILAKEVFGWVLPHEEWWTRPLLALESPLTAVCRYESEPFLCSETGLVTYAPNPDLYDVDLTNFEKRAGVRAAIVVPVHLPFGRIGAASFTSFDPQKCDLSVEFKEHGRELGIYATAFITTYAKTVAKKRKTTARGRLNKREIECIRWAAVGKTDADIGAILGVTRATVRFHIAKAATKLSAVNRSQCVYKATQLGYIEPL